MANTKKKQAITSPPNEKLTKAEEFYIDNNLNKTDLELSNDLLKPISIIQKHLHRTKSDSRINKLLIRKKGCVIMTEGASMESDKSRKSYVTEMAIKTAVDKGDYEEASRLQKIFREQCQQTNDETRQRNENYIHHIKQDG